MRLLISTVCLKNGLGSFDLTSENIHTAHLHPHDNFHVLTLTSDKRSVDIHCVALKESGGIKDTKYRRWDWIKQLVELVGEQPIILDIGDRIIDVIFQY